MGSIVTSSSLKYLVGIALFFLLMITVNSTQDDESSSICQGAQNCGDCISADPSCAWCTSVNYTGVRCDTFQNLNITCENITNPEAITLIEQDRHMNSIEEENAGHFVQVSPQKIRVKVRPGVEHTVQLKVRPSIDFPLDIYYAMDFSKSMEDDLSMLSSLTSTLVRHIGNVTSDFKLGFGAFVDKPVNPYINTSPIRKENYCIRSKKKNDYCGYPFGFHNILPLTSDHELFADRISRSEISGNKDTPEGGFDALMQVAVCDSEIGWRSNLTNARHVVVFTTDGSYHSAGDGKTGGIVEPNDGLCHMDPETNMYNWSTLQDYPSIGHLNEKLRENNILTIFAVTKKRVASFRKLTKYIEGATVVELDGNSRNIVDLISQSCTDISKKVKLTSTAPRDVELSYTAECLDGMIVEGANQCDNISLGESVSFDIGLTVQNCFEGVKWFTVGPVGMREKLEIGLEVMCSCDCESLKAENSTLCSGNGSLVCGECECNAGRYGEECECRGDLTSDGELDETSTCKMSNTSRTCSGRGQCVCGKCSCDETGVPGNVISGKYCECDNFNCPYSMDLRCGGPERGTCVCDVATRQPKCKCKAGYTGPSCDCPTQKDTCRSVNGLECNALGTCVCGVCQCSGHLYRGRTCEECPVSQSCLAGDCYIHRDCVECRMFGTGRLTQEQCDMCDTDIVNVTDITQYTIDVTPCTFSSDNGTCTFSFVLVSENKTPIVYAEGEKKCVRSRGRAITESEILIMACTITGGVVVIGLIVVVVWRIYTYVEDEREFKQFEEEVHEPQWKENRNSLYISPRCSIYINPLFGR